MNDTCGSGSRADLPWCATVRGTGPTGPSKNIGITGYSTDQKKYTYWGLDNTAMAMTTVAKGTVEGDNVDLRKTSGPWVASRTSPRASS